MFYGFAFLSQHFFVCFNRLLSLSILYKFEATFDKNIGVYKTALRHKNFRCTSLQHLTKPTDYSPLRNTLTHFLTTRNTLLPMPYPYPSSTPSFVFARNDKRHEQKKQNMIKKLSVYLQSCARWRFLDAASVVQFAANFVSVGTPGFSSSRRVEHGATACKFSLCRYWQSIIRISVNCWTETFNRLTFKAIWAGFMLILVHLCALM